MNTLNKINIYDEEEFKKLAITQKEKEINKILLEIDHVLQLMLEEGDSEAVIKEYKKIAKLPVEERMKKILTILEATNKNKSI